MKPAHTTPARLGAFLCSTFLLFAAIDSEALAASIVLFFVSAFLAPVPTANTPKP